jgi:hypothetical protein
MVALPRAQNILLNIHNPHAAAMRVRAHPRDLEISAEDLAFYLRVRLLAEYDTADLLSYGTAQFTTTVNFLINSPTIPSSLLGAPFLGLPSGDQVPLSFPYTPPSRFHCFSLEHRALDCPQHRPPPSRRICGISKRAGCSIPGPMLRKERCCFFCDKTDHVIAQCPEIACRYCHITGHKMRNCVQAAAVKEARAAAREAFSSASSKAVCRTTPARPPRFPHSLPVEPSWR